MSTHAIELSRNAVLATRKLFNHLTTDDLEAAGFDCVVRRLLDTY
jgi:hypothetical protein